MYSNLYDALMKANRMVCVQYSYIEFIIITLQVQEYSLCIVIIIAVTAKSNFHLKIELS